MIGKDTNMDSVKFSLPFAVKAKPRPKVTRSGSVYYADAQYMQWRAMVLAEALVASAGRQFPNVPLKVDIVLYSDSFSVVVTRSDKDYQYVRPDTDNAAGAVFDAMQGKKGEKGLILNDRLVREFSCRVAEKGEAP